MFSTKHIGKIISTGKQQWEIKKLDVIADYNENMRDGQFKTFFFLNKMGLDGIE